MAGVAVGDANQAKHQINPQIYGVQAHQPNGGRLAFGREESAPSVAPKGEKKSRRPLPQRWRMLAILSVDICISYLPWYTFVPIMSQSMAVYNVTAADLNMLCIVFSLVYIPSVFLTGTLLSTLGCHWCFTLATSCVSAGCVLRCGPGVAMRFFSTAYWDFFSAAQPEPFPQLAPFAWLLAGQALCAVGQAFLVNATSHLSAEWFHPDERPAAAMTSNLMNFIGGASSFMLPTLYVSEEWTPESTRQQVTQLMDAQLKISLAALVLTFALYRDAPVNHRAGSAREEIPLFSEFWRVLRLKDFWMVNGHFVLYLTVLNTFDAIEGSLLASYGYSEALSSWTAASFTVSSIVSTAVESVIIKHPAHYRSALLGINGVMGVSLLVGLVCLKWQLPDFCFVFAVGLFGFSTPGWGCSLEMGCEVCYPVREATVSSLLEAFGSIASIGGIVIAQHLIDNGQAAMVLISMALCALAGSGALLGLSGRLHRREAEELCESEGEIEASDGLGVSAGHSQGNDLHLRQRGGKTPAWAEFQFV